MVPYLDALQFCLIALGIALLLMVLLPLMERWRISIRVTIEPNEIVARPEPPQLTDTPAVGETTRLARRGSVR